MSPCFLFETSSGPVVVEWVTERTNYVFQHMCHFWVGLFSWYLRAANSDFVYSSKTRFAVGSAVFLDHSLLNPVSVRWPGRVRIPSWILDSTDVMIPGKGASRGYGKVCAFTLRLVRVPVYSSPKMEKSLLSVPNAFAARKCCFFPDPRAPGRYAFTFHAKRFRCTEELFQPGLAMWPLVSLLPHLFLRPVL